jgi:hypothetical protein
MLQADWLVGRIAAAKETLLDFERGAAASNTTMQFLQHLLSSTLD